MLTLYMYVLVCNQQGGLMNVWYKIFFGACILYIAVHVVTWMVR